jgi:phage gpG-like protein
MGNDNQNIHGIDDLTRRLQMVKHYIQFDVLEVLGIESVKHFKRNFQQEGFDGTKWETRKSKRSGSTNSQKILTFSGELSESIDYRIEGNSVIISSDKPYAQIHNEGGRITVTDKMRKFFWAMHYKAKESSDTGMADQYKAFALSKEIVMIRRKFMGESPELINNAADKIKRDLNTILKG